MRKELVVVALLVVGIVLGFGIGYVASPGKVSTTTVVSVSTLTLTTVPEKSIVVTMSSAPLTIVYGARGIEAKAPESTFSIELSRDGKTLYIEIAPFSAKGSVVVRARLLDASGRILAEGTALVTAQRELKAAIDLGWYTQPNPSRISTIAIEVSTG